MKKIALFPHLLVLAICSYTTAEAQTAGAGAGAGTSYLFTDVADTFSGGVVALYDAAINNSETVAVVAQLDAEHAGILTVRNGNVGLVADTQGELSSLANISLNDADEVAFFGVTDAGLAGVFRSRSGGDLVTIADSDGEIDWGAYATSLSNSGAVAFTASLDDGSRGVLVGDGQALNTVWATGLELASPIVSAPSINESNTVAFALRYNADIPDGFVSELYRANGGAAQAIASSTGALSAISLPAIDYRGNVAFASQSDAGKHGIFRAADGAPSEVLDLGALTAYDAVYSVATNDRGEVAVTLLTSTSAGYAVGVYTGPDLVNDRVLGTGDTLFGRVVRHAIISKEGLNDFGEMAILVEFDDGHNAVAHVVPVKAPKLQVKTPNVNVTSTGVVTVILYGDESIGTNTIDYASLRLGGATPSSISIKDLNKDKRADATLSFRIKQTNLVSVYTELLAADKALDGRVNSTKQPADVMLEGRTAAGSNIAANAKLTLYASGSALTALLNSLP